MEHGVPTQQYLGAVPSGPTEEEKARGIQADLSGEGRGGGFVTQPGNFLPFLKMPSPNQQKVGPASSPAAQAPTCP